MAYIGTIADLSCTHWCVSTRIPTDREDATSRKYRPIKPFAPREWLMRQVRPCYAWGRTDTEIGRPEFPELLIYWGKGRYLWLMYGDRIEVLDARDGLSVLTLPIVRRTAWEHLVTSSREALAATTRPKGKKKGPTAWDHLKGK